MSPFIKTIRKESPYTPQRSAIWMRYKCLYWVYPKRHQGKPVKSFALTYSRPTQKHAMNIGTKRDPFRQVIRLEKKAGYRAR